MADTRQFEIQIVEAVRAIGKSISAGGTGGSSSSSSPTTAQITALNNLVGGISALTKKMDKLIEKIGDALFIEVEGEPTGDTETAEGEPEKKGLATLFSEQNEMIEKIRDAVFYEEEGEEGSEGTILTALMELTAMRKALDGTTAAGVSSRMLAIGTNTAAVAENIQAGDADIAHAVAGTPRPQATTIVYGSVVNAVFTPNAGQVSLATAAAAYANGGLVYLRYTGGSGAIVLDMVTYCEVSTPRVMTNNGVEWTESA